MQRPIPILLYHGVAEDAPERLAPFVMAPDRFAAHMRAIAARGCQTFTVSELCDHLDGEEPVPPNTVLITFDDGLADFDDHAWPVLRSLGLAATHYVVSGHIGGEATWLGSFGPPPRMLSWEQVRRLDAEGCEIGAHSMTHPELDTLPYERVVEEVRDARLTLAAKLGHPIRSFAYPHGYHHRRVKEVVRRAGYDSACAVRNMLSSTDDDRFALARVTIGGACEVAELERVLDGIGLKVAPRREAVRTKGWRTYRRLRHRQAAVRA